ncbi:MAG: single-stranded DNA-binding protein [Oscillospiraceae bacterium]|nr:single-stranded DNA-binding protein [Oscillospiraceae bacterium]
MNNVLLRGTVSEPAAYSHESHGRQYFQLILATTRLSGTEDLLRILLPEMLLQGCDPRPGDRVAVEGALRSFNNKSGRGSRLVLSALAKSLTLCDGPSENRVELAGTLCKPPVYRRTPLGREICDLMLAVPRPYGRADYLPIIAWGTCARVCADLGVGDAVSIEGRFQSRKYIKLVGDASEEKTAYEVSAVHVTAGENGQQAEESPDD